MSAAAGGPDRHAPVLGILWMAGAALCFAGSISMVRYLTDKFSPFEIVVFRMILGLVILTPMIARRGFASFRTDQLRWHCARNWLSYLGMVCSYFSVVYITLSDAIALQFTLPLFSIFFAMILLGERVGRHRWTATIVGFGGALIIVQPGFQAVNFGMVIALAAAMFYSSGDTMTRLLARKDSTPVILFYGFLVQLPVGIVPAALNWVTPGWGDMPAILAFAAFGVAAQFCLTRSFSVAEVSLVTPVLFLRLPFVAVIGYAVFGQATAPATWVGAAVLVAATVYMGRQEQRIARQRPA